jgi:hypothetical protein
MPKREMESNMGFYQKIIFFVITILSIGCSQNVYRQELGYESKLTKEERLNPNLIVSEVNTNFPSGTAVKDLEKYVISLSGACGFYNEKELSFCEIYIGCKYQVSSKFKVYKGIIKSIKTTSNRVVCD